MDDEQPFPVCPTCGERVDPSDPSLVYGLEQIVVETMGPTHQNLDGLGAYFHPECFPGLPTYRLTPRPARSS